MKDLLNNLFEEIKEFAERNQTCLRKAVGCAAVSFQDDGSPFVVTMKHNGPSREDHECTNEVGNCGCSHAEPRVVQALLEELDMTMPLVLICTYSPCTTCANIIIDSGLFSGCVYDMLTLHDTRGEEFLRQAMPVMDIVELNHLTEEEASDRIKEWISG